MDHFHHARSVFACVFLITAIAGTTLESCQTGLQTGQTEQVTATPTFVLAGDSTVTDEAGWGKGFAELLADGVSCVNLAKSGRSSRSYRSEGWWDKCLEARPQYLLIQFGHNDQPGKGPERESLAATDFREHLKSFVLQSRELGIQPVLVSSLTRRRWTNEGKIEPTLSNYAEATRAVAQQLQVPWIDLHELSIRHCEELGPLHYRAFEPMKADGADHTHLNSEGGRAVAALVVGALIKALPEVKDCFVADRIDQFSAPTRYLHEQLSGKLALKLSREGITIHAAERLMLNYNIESPALPEGMNPAYRRTGFLHPVMTPQGSLLTATFPIDHAHQHGIFAAWVKTSWMDREIDFWNLAKGSGRVLHQRVVNTVAGEGHVGFEVDLVYRSQQIPEVDILRERWRVTAYDSTEGYYQFDIASEQTALTDQPLLIEKYHYGGMAYRGPVQWLSSEDSTAKKLGLTSDNFRIISEAGDDRKATDAKPARWVIAGGNVDSDQSAYIVVLSHQTNFRSPQPARLHPTKPYFVFSPCSMDSFTIDANTPYTAKYRYLTLDRQPTVEWVAAQWQAWHSETP